MRSSTLTLLTLTSTILLLTLGSVSLHAQGVGIGTNTPDPSAALDISSDTSGILIPRMTAAQRDAINGPVVGLMVFVTDDMRFYCYEGSSWEKVGGDETIMVDADGDTKIQVEEGPDDDTIRFDMGGTEYFRMANGRLEVHNTGRSIMIGRAAGLSDDFSDNDNVFIGDSTGTNTTANGNTAVGSKAMLSNTTGFQNVAIGECALFSNTDGVYNMASGYRALYYNTTGGFNTASGVAALRTNTTGGYNTAFGNQTLYFNTTGENNTASGYQALLYNTTGNYNTASGYQAGYNSAGDGSVYIGNKAGYFETASNRLYVENSDADSANALIYGEFDNDWLRINGRLTPTMGMTDADGDTRVEVEGTPDDDTIRFVMDSTEFFRMANGRLEVANTGGSVFIGQGAGAAEDLDLDNTSNVFIGDSSGTVNTNGGANVGVGDRTLYSNIDGNFNSAFGSGALYSNILGDQNTAIGHNALYSNTGSHNTAIGSQALSSNVNGEYNTAMGHGALNLNISGWYNTGIGREALYQNTTGMHNTAMGNLSLNKNITGGQNTAIGRRAMQFNTTGSYNTGLGNDALNSNVAGSYNIALGSEAGYSALGDSSVYIGNRAGYGDTAGHRLYIENSDADSASALIYGEFDNDLLRINGRLIASMGLSDADGDTRIQVEEGPDDDTIRFDMAGTEFFKMANGRLEVLNTGYSVLIGEGAGAGDDFSDNQNVYIGYMAGNEIGSYSSTGIGYQALLNSTGYGNTAIGHTALESNTSGGSNTALGRDAMGANTTGSSSVAIGVNALGANDTGDRNIALGTGALRNNVLGNNNIAVGYQSGYSALDTGSIFIGYQAGYSETQGDRLYIENSNAGAADALIYGEFDNDILSFNANVGIGTTSPTNALHVIGDGLFSDTLRATLALKTFNNAKDVGLAFQFQADHYGWNIYQEGGSSDLVFSGGNEADIKALPEIMRLTDSGDVGIGTTTPTEKLEISGGDALISRTTLNETRKLTISGARSISGVSYAEIDFVNYDGNTMPLSDYVGARIASENGSNTNDGDLRFYTYDGSLQLRMMIADTGLVGIGTATPSHKLHVAGGNILADRGAPSGVNRKLILEGARSGGNLEFATVEFKNYDFDDIGEYTGAKISSGNPGSGQGNLQFYTYDGNLELRMTIVDTGAVGIGTENPDELFTVNGNASKSAGGNTWVVSSDIRLKDIDGTFDRGLEEVMALQPVFFHYKKDNPLGLQSKQQNVGFIAQDVQKVIPEAIDDSGEYLKLQADPIYLAMLNSIKELKAENDALKEELAAYQTDIEARLRALENSAPMTDR